MNYSMYATFTGLVSLFREKHVRFCDFNECVTDRQTDRPTDGHSPLQRCEDASKKEQVEKNNDDFVDYG